MFSAFPVWSSMGQIMHRMVCFKGDGGSTEVPETEAQRASSEIAMKNYNDYMSTIRPLEEKYIDDVTGDPTIRENQVAGQVNADIAQRVGTPAINPNRGMAPGSVADLATTKAAATVKGDQAVKDQRAVGYQSVIDAGMGKATQSQQGMAGLAAQSVDTAIRNMDIQQKSRDASLSAGATGVALAGKMGMDLYNDNTKK